MNDQNPYAAPQSNLSPQASEASDDAPRTESTLDAEQFQLFSVGALILAVLWSPLFYFMMGFGPLGFFCLTIASTVAVCCLCKLPPNASGKLCFAAAALLLTLGNLILLADFFNVMNPWSCSPAGSSTTILTISVILIVSFFVTVGFYQLAASLRIEVWAHASLSAVFLLVLLGGMWTINLWADNIVMEIAIFLTMISVYFLIWFCMILGISLPQTILAKQQAQQSSLKN